MASAGFGTLPHLCLEMFRYKAGITVHHVPYRGGAQALNDLMSGHVNYYFASAVSATGLIKAGKLRALAHTWTGRLVGLADIPPLSETFPGFEALDWNGVFVRHGTSPEIVEKLNATLNTVLDAPQVSARYAQLNMQSRHNSPDDFREFVESQMLHWGNVVKEMNIRVG
jgi:tripartite-type tricarboxylate transporter receptor subunit TctC